MSSGPVTKKVFDPAPLLGDLSALGGLAARNFDEGIVQPAQEDFGKLRAALSRRLSPALAQAQATSADLSAAKYHEANKWSPQNRPQFWKLPPVNQALIDNFYATRKDLAANAPVPKANPIEASGTPSQELPTKAPLPPVPAKIPDSWIPNDDPAAQPPKVELAGNNKAANNLQSSFGLSFPQLQSSTGISTPSLEPSGGLDVGRPFRFQGFDPLKKRSLGDFSKAQPFADSDPQPGSNWRNNGQWQSGGSPSNTPRNLWGADATPASLNRAPVSWGTPRPQVQLQPNGPRLVDPAATPSASAQPPAQDQQPPLPKDWTQQPAAPAPQTPAPQPEVSEPTVPLPKDWTQQPGAAPQATTPPAQPPSPWPQGVRGQEPGWSVKPLPQGGPATLPEAAGFPAPAPAPQPPAPAPAPQPQAWGDTGGPSSNPLVNVLNPEGDVAPGPSFGDSWGTAPTPAPQQPAPQPPAPAPQQTAPAPQQPAPAPAPQQPAPQPVPQEIVPSDNGDGTIRVPKGMEPPPGYEWTGSDGQGRKIYSPIADVYGNAAKPGMGREQARDQWLMKQREQQVAQNREARKEQARQQLSRLRGPASNPDYHAQVRKLNEIIDDRPRDSWGRPMDAETAARVNKIKADGEAIRAANARTKDLTDRTIKRYGSVKNAPPEVQWGIVDPDSGQNITHLTQSQADLDQAVANAPKAIPASWYDPQLANR